MRVLRRLGGLAGVALVFGLAGAYVGSHRETEALDADARARVGGTWAELTRGATHYALSGPPDGPVVVLIHGGTIPMWTWDAQVGPLTAAGFRVLRYDQFGRGWSDRPEATYDRTLYLGQLEELLDTLQIPDPVTLIGVSFGGATAANFAAAHPGRVDRIVLLAPVVDYTEGRPLFALAGTPGLGEWYARVVSVPQTERRAAGFFAAAGADPDYAARFAQQTRLEGYERALLSMARTDALAAYHDVYQAITDTPTLVIWGEADREIPRAHMDFLEATLPQGELVVVPGAGHGLHMEKADEINPRLLAFLGHGT